MRRLHKEFTADPAERTREAIARATPAETPDSTLLDALGGESALVRHAARRRSAISRCPFSSATSSGVRPSSFLALGLAPCFNSNSTIGLSPCWAAACSAVQPL